MRSKNLLLLGIGLLAGIGAGWLVLSIGNAGSLLSLLRPPVEAADNFNALKVGPKVGYQPPDFSLINPSGELVHLRDFRGRPVLINFWATWCGPCRIEMPLIQAKYEEHYPDLAVLAINFDEPLEKVRAFVEEFGLSFEILLDSGGEVNQRVYRVLGYPSSYFIDREGVIQEVHIGLLTEGQLEDNLEKIGLGE